MLVANLMIKYKTLGSTLGLTLSVTYKNHVWQQCNSWGGGTILVTTNTKVNAMTSFELFGDLCEDKVMARPYTPMDKTPIESHDRSKHI